MKIRKYKNVDCDLLNYAQVKITDMGKFYELQHIERKFIKDTFGVKKISSEEYVVVDSGEIRQYKHGENRTDNVDGLRKTFKKIRGIVNYNFSQGDNELIFTLTYKENITDTKKLYFDFQSFIYKLKYKYGNIEYMNVVEPQARGAWHCHVLLKFCDLEKIYIPSSDIAKMWGNGFVTVKKIRKDVDNLGAYLSAYLGDVSVDEVDSEYIKEHYNRCEIKTVTVDGKQKKIIKGGRLHMYPLKMNIYRKSRGIKIPPTEEMEYREFKDVIKDKEPCYTSIIRILNDDDIEFNRICYEIYKK